MMFPVMVLLMVVGYLLILWAWSSRVRSSGVVLWKIVSLETFVMIAGFLIFVLSAIGCLHELGKAGL